MPAHERLTPSPRAEKLKRWPQNPIDHFVLDRLFAEGLMPSPEADAHALIRRITSQKRAEVEKKLAAWLARTDLIDAWLASEPVAAASPPREAQDGGIAVFSSAPPGRIVLSSDPVAGATG